MKFKLSERFLTFIAPYNQSYVWAQEENDDFGVLSITDNQNFVPNIQNVIAQKLLSQFHKQAIAKPNIIISQWLQQYANSMIQNQVICQSLNNALLAKRLNELKLKIVTKKQELLKQMKINQQQKGKYSDNIVEQQNKLRLGIENLQYRLKISLQNQQQCNEQLERVKSILKNGVWGLLPQVEQKIQRIKALQSQIQKLKLENNSG